MHWGLTAFERKRIERIALDHPYFDMHAQLLTKKELRTILAQDPYKTGPQVVAEVKKELGIAYAPITQKKRTFAEALRDASFVPSFRRTVVLGVLSLLLVLFMTLTVPGRTFAEEVYSIIIEFVNGSLKSYHFASPESEASFYEVPAIPEDVQSPQELSTLIGLPVYYTDDSLVSFYYNSNSSRITMKTQYAAENGNLYMVYQRIYASNINYGTDTEIDDSFEQFADDSGVTMYAGIASDGINIIIWYPDQSIVRITSDTIPISELKSIANSIHKVP